MTSALWAPTALLSSLLSTLYLYPFLPQPGGRMAQCFLPTVMGAAAAGDPVIQSARSPANYPKGRVYHK